jgi:hypothetical protein
MLVHYRSPLYHRPFAAVVTVLLSCGPPPRLFISVHHHHHPYYSFSRRPRAFRLYPQHSFSCWVASSSSPVAVAVAEVFGQEEEEEDPTPTTTANEECDNNCLLITHPIIITQPPFFVGSTLRRPPISAEQQQHADGRHDQSVPCARNTLGRSDVTTIPIFSSDRSLELFHTSMTPFSLVRLCATTESTTTTTNLRRNSSSGTPTAGTTTSRFPCARARSSRSEMTTIPMFSAPIVALYYHDPLFCWFDYTPPPIHHHPFQRNSSNPTAGTTTSRFRTRAQDQVDQM